MRHRKEKIEHVRLPDRAGEFTLSAELTRRGPRLVLTHPRYVLGVKYTGKMRLPVGVRIEISSDELIPGQTFGACATRVRKNDSDGVRDVAAINYVPIVGDSVLHSQFAGARPIAPPMTSKPTGSMLADPTPPRDAVSSLPRLTTPPAGTSDIFGASRPTLRDARRSAHDRDNL